MPGLSATEQEREGFCVPKPRRPDYRTTPLEVERLVVRSRDQGSRS
jgi:hypothetical protein